MKRKKLFETLGEITFCATVLADLSLITAAVKHNWGDSWAIIFVVVLLVLSFFATLYPLLKKTKITTFEKIVVAACALFLVAAIIVISSSAEGHLKETVPQILAQCLGGVLTLYGVGITIKFNRLQKMDDERKKAAPSLYALSEEAWSHLSKNCKFARQLEVSSDLSTIKEAKKDDSQFGFKEIRLENSGESACVFMGLLVNDDQWLVFQFDNVVPKGLSCGFTIPNSFKESCSIQTVSLVMGDMLGNVYGIPTSFKTEKMGKVTKVEVMGLFAPALLPEEKLVAFGDRGVK